MSRFRRGFILHSSAGSAVVGRFLNFRCLFLAISILWIVMIVCFISCSTRITQLNDTPATYDTLTAKTKGLKPCMDANLTKPLEDSWKQFKQNASRAAPPCLTAVKFSSSHEFLRRRSVNNAHEIWNMASAQLDKLNKRLKGNISSLDDNLQDMVTSLRRQLYDITLSLLVDLDGIGRVNGLAASRALDLNQLSSLIQDRIRVLQNPSDCKKAKFMLVSLNRPCAFGCNVHHLVYCFQVAYATGRTLAFDSSDTSHYTSWWEQNFEPLAKNCDRDGAETVANLDNIYSNITTLKCPYIFDFDAKLEILPQAIPDDLAPALMRLHGRPSVWFMGQLLHYLMRPRPHLQEMLDRFASSYKLTGPNRSPVVGVHVRRTDKLVMEAKFHSLNEYMVHVDRYFDFIDRQRQMMARNSEWIGDLHAPSTPSASKVARQVFLATDDPSVFEDAVVDFPHHKFHGDPNRARSADVQRRGTNDSILGITLDIMLLSKADYLVCTFSSQVCRVAYELMQARHQELGDASSLAKSIDSFYYFGGEQTSYCEVIVDDEDNGIQRGTLVQMLGNNWDGFSVVKRKDQDKSFSIPSYKLQDRILVAQMGYHTLTA